jgi:hypothetical protein
MRKKTFGTKLTFKKETLSNLHEVQLNEVRGGATYGTCYNTCPGCETNNEKTCKCPFIQTVGDSCWCSVFDTSCWC